MKMENLYDILYVIGGLLLIIPALVILFFIVMPILWGIVIISIPLIIFVVIPGIIIEMVNDSKNTPTNK